MSKFYNKCLENLFDVRERHLPPTGQRQKEERVEMKSWTTTTTATTAITATTTKDRRV